MPVGAPSASRFESNAPSPRKPRSWGRNIEEAALGPAKPQRRDHCYPNFFPKRLRATPLGSRRSLPLPAGASQEADASKCRASARPCCAPARAGQIPGRTAIRPRASDRSNDCTQGDPRPAVRTLSRRSGLTGQRPFTTLETSSRSADTPPSYSIVSSLRMTGEWGSACGLMGLIPWALAWKLVLV